MRISRMVALGVAGTVGLAGLGAVVVAAPVATAAVTEDGADATAAERVAARVLAVREALAGLVGDGSITQEQADEVATTLGESEALRGGPGGHGGPGRGGGLAALDDVAEDLGLDLDQLRTALATEGTTVAEAAQAQGVETAVLVDALVAEASEHLAEEVEEGDLTQARADEIAAGLEERVAEAVEREAPFGGRGGRGPWGGDDDAADDEAPSTSATPSSTT